MSTATERIPILVTKSDKGRFIQKAKSFGFDSVSEFARKAMEHFTPPTQEDAALEAFVAQVKTRTATIEQSLETTIQFCDASNERMKALDGWMQRHGYTFSEGSAS